MISATKRSLQAFQQFRAIGRSLLVAIVTTGLLAPTAYGWQAATAPASLSASEREAADGVKLETIRETTTALAAADMQGRGTAQPGGDKAAQYIADRFAKLGLKPLGDAGTYLQAVKFKINQPLPETSMKIGDEALKYGDEFVIAPHSLNERSLSGNLVFVAYGLRDDFGTLDLRNKVAVLINGPPQNTNEEAWKKAKADQLIITNLLRQGVAALIITNGGTKQTSYATLAGYFARRRVAQEDQPEWPATAPPFVYLSDAGAEKLFAGSGITYREAKAKADKSEFVSRSLNKVAKFAIRVKKDKGTGSNVVGLLEGADPALKAQAVIYSAHYDAFGIDPGGRIYPGAADNALGVAQMLAVAEAFARMPARPRRSIIFLAVTGEEYGLLGSEQWVRHPTWKLQNVAADLNFDGMGTEVYGPVKRIVGFGKEHSDLGAVLESVVAATGNAVVPDPMPEEKSFYRSDHYAFVKKGVPALMLMGLPEMDKAALIARLKQWEETDYHQPTDTVRADWNWDGPRTIATVGLIIGMRVAGQDALPVWLPSSPFNQPRGTNKPPPEQ
jgi:hypothetical protein